MTLISPASSQPRTSAAIGSSKTSPSSSNTAPPSPISTSLQTLSAKSAPSFPSPPTPPSPPADLAPLLQYIPAEQRSLSRHRSPHHRPGHRRPQRQAPLSRLRQLPRSPHRTSSRPLRSNRRQLHRSRDPHRHAAHPPTASPDALAAAPRSRSTPTPLDAVLTYSSAASSHHTATDNLFLPIHTAVILSSPTPFNPTSLQSALTEALRAHLTVSAASLTWQPHQQGNITYLQLEGLQHLAFAIQGKLCILASDPETLLQSLTRPRNATPTRFSQPPSPASTTPPNARASSASPRSSIAPPTPNPATTTSPSSPAT